MNTLLYYHKINCLEIILFSLLRITGSLIRGNMGVSFNWKLKLIKNGACFKAVYNFQDISSKQCIDALQGSNLITSTQSQGSGKNNIVVLNPEIHLHSNSNSSSNNTSGSMKYDRRIKVTTYKSLF